MATPMKIHPHYANRGAHRWYRSSEEIEMTIPKEEVVKCGDEIDLGYEIARCEKPLGHRKKHLCGAHMWSDGGKTLVERKREAEKAAKKLIDESF
jgi:hypothetical protein